VRNYDLIYELAAHKLFDAARYSVGFAVHVAMAKYADYLSRERGLSLPPMKPTGD